VTDLTRKRPSYRLFSEGFFLTERQMDWYRSHYLAEESHAGDPRVSPVLAADLAGLPPAHVVTAGFDVLRDEGEDYAAVLRDAGVAVTTAREAGLIHGFTHGAETGRAPRAAMLRIAAALRDGLAAASTGNRGARIRTGDLTDPNGARYQAALRPEVIRAES
jgi:acetyl esterase